MKIHPISSEQKTILATRIKNYPDVDIPTEEYLTKEVKEPGVSQKELAKRMARPTNAINELINSKKAITAETALQLENAMPEIVTRFWLTLETDYQLTKTLIKRNQAAG